MTADCKSLGDGVSAGVGVGAGSGVGAGAVCNSSGIASRLHNAIIQKTTKRDLFIVSDLLFWPMCTFSLDSFKIKIALKYFYVIA